MKNKSADWEDIERAVYDGMQDLRTRNPALNPRPKHPRKPRPKRRARRRG